MNISILNKEKCTGCGVCKNSCQVCAIEMHNDDKGFAYPFISDNCIDCGLCAKNCPQLNNSHFKNSNVEYYAAWANAPYREMGSSGGVFPLIATNFIKNGGVICGPIYMNNCRTLKYSFTDKEEEISRMFKSKYVQSDCDMIHSSVRKLLDEGRSVLFSGCPCQVDGLKHYLQKDYKKLFLIDILCHGVPSPTAYSSFIDEISEGKKVINVDFRDKTYGWGTLMKISFEDGSYKYHPWDGQYFKAFLSGLTIRPSCNSCPYAEDSRVGDITLGDFWNINSIDNSLDDKRGTSIISCNTIKGCNLINELSGLFERIEKINNDIVKEHQTRFNAAIAHPVPINSMRNCFFKHLNQGDSFSKAYNYSQKSIMDVGILGWWNETSQSNYGSTLTAFSLYKYLEDSGYSVGFISPPEFDRADAGKFCKENGYRMTMKYKATEMSKNNDYFDSYIVGSDVLWYYKAFIKTGYMFMLDFADERTKRISYSTSFGNTKSFFPEHELLNARYFLQKFDSVSVREYEGVDICKEFFNVDAIQVMDPIFLCPMHVWQELIKKATKKTEDDFIFAYLLDPSKENVTELKLLSELLGNRLVSVTDKQFMREEKEKILSDCGVIKNASIYDLLYHIKNAKCVITDSFHGFCLSLIFNRPFLCIVNTNRGGSRFETLASIAGVENNLIYNVDLLSSRALKVINCDYRIINEKISKKIELSKKWLLNAIDSEKVAKKIDFQTLLGKEIYDLSKKVDSFILQNEDYK